MDEYDDENYAYHHNLQNMPYEDYEYMDEDDYNALSHGQGDQNLERHLEQRLAKHSPQDEFHNLRSNCMGTTLKQGLDHAKLTVLLCLFLRCLLIFLQQYFPRSVKSIRVFHVVTIACGLAVVHGVYTDIIYIVATVFCVSCTLLYCICWFSYRHGWRCGLVTALCAVFCIMFAEFSFSDPKLWNRLRGVLLLLAMKIISVAFDFQSNKSEQFPSPLEYFSYMFHPGFLIYGPWICLANYRDYLYTKRPVDLDWVYSVVKSAIQASVCLVLSVCVLPYLFIDPLQPYNPALLPVVGSKWLMSYCTAISFHFSHYYIGYLSVLSSVASGVGTLKLTQKSKKNDDPEEIGISWSKYKVVMPLKVEMPRSMLNVVVAWNIPMSQWLKKYVFDVSRFLGDFPAIVFTYVASAMLHGLSLHLAAVLLSLGFYTYTEHAVRLKLSKAFNCPAIQARPPKPTAEKTNPTPLWAKLFNLTWVFINLMHLAYLGSLFESNPDAEEMSGLQFTLSKWGELHYFSHWFALGCFLVNLLL